MVNKYNINTITKDTFASILSEYPSYITTPKLQSLDQQRQTITNTVRARLSRPHEPPSKHGPSSEPKGAYLTKDELTTLMDWKLSHGKFRPALVKLIRENSPESVLEISSKAFEAYSPFIRDPSPSAPEEVLKGCVKTLSQFRGVGPATASLLLATLDPEKIAFFGDEVFRWVMHGHGNGNGNGGKGWGREIKYSVGELLEFWKGVEGVRKRLGVGSGDVERVGFVLGKKGVDLQEKDGESGGEGKSAEKGVKRKVGGIAKTEPLATAKKAKVERIEGKTESTSLRRSDRTK